MNDNRWEPRGRLCPDGTIGRQDTSKKSTRITPLFDQSRVNIDGYAMTITVPAKVGNYNPPREEIKGYMAIPDDLRKIAEELVIPENSYIQGIEEDIE